LGNAAQIVSKQLYSDKQNKNNDSVMQTNQFCCKEALKSQFSVDFVLFNKGLYGLGCLLSQFKLINRLIDGNNLSSI